VPLPQLAETGIAATIVLIEKLEQHCGFHGKLIKIRYSIVPLFNNTATNFRENVCRSLMCEEFAMNYRKNIQEKRICI
jgi:hypothetical protein